MTLDETIEKIDEDLHEIDLIDRLDYEDKAEQYNLSLMKQWIKAAKERYDGKNMR